LVKILAERKIEFKSSGRKSQEPRVCPEVSGQK
jgi:hypothetical protein